MRDGRIGGERQGVENNILVNKNGKKKPLVMLLKAYN